LPDPASPFNFRHAASKLQALALLDLKPRDLESGAPIRRDYDQVSTVPYKPDDTMALNLARSKRWEDVGLESFRRMARKVGADESRMADHARAAVASIVDVWNDSGADFGDDRATREIIAGHMKRVPLLRR
jgi:hypothetical protein